MFSESYTPGMIEVHDTGLVFGFHGHPCRACHPRKCTPTSRWRSLGSVFSTHKRNNWLITCNLDEFETERPFINILV